MLEKEAKEAVFRLEKTNEELKKKFEELFMEIQKVKSISEQRIILERWNNYVKNNYETEVAGSFNYNDKA